MYGFIDSEQNEKVKDKDNTKETKHILVPKTSGTLKYVEESIYKNDKPSAQNCRKHLNLGCDKKFEEPVTEDFAECKDRQNLWHDAYLFYEDIGVF